MDDVSQIKCNHTRRMGIPILASINFPNINIESYDDLNRKGVVFQRLCLRFGPYLFIRCLELDIYATRRLYMSEIYIMIYWLWRISHNKDFYNPAAWKLPRSIIIKITELAFSGERDLFLKSWDSSKFRRFRKKVLAK